MQCMCCVEVYAQREERKRIMPASATAAVTEPVKKDSVPEIIAASMVGTAIEFYDNYCYSIAAASYFGAIFFANVTNPALAQIMAFTTFAVSFLARPFGSMLFGHFGDKMGRKKTLVIALLTMGVATFLVGCLPGYEQVGGVSVVILCVPCMPGCGPRRRMVRRRSGGH